MLVVKGRVDHKQQGETKLIALEITPFEAVPERREVRLKVDARIAPAGLIRELADVVGALSRRGAGLRRGGHVVGPKLLELGPKVQPIPDFFAEAKALLGEAAVL